MYKIPSYLEASPFFLGGGGGEDKTKNLNVSTEMYP